MGACTQPIFILLLVLAQLCTYVLYIYEFVIISLFGIAKLIYNTVSWCLTSWSEEEFVNLFESSQKNIKKSLPLGSFFHTQNITGLKEFIKHIGKHYLLMTWFTFKYSWHTLFCLKSSKNWKSWIDYFKMRSNKSTDVSR